MKLKNLFSMMLLVIFLSGIMVPIKFFAAKDDTNKKESDLLSKYQSLDFSDDQIKKIKNSSAYKSAVKTDEHWSSLSPKKQKVAQRLKLDRLKKIKTLESEIKKHLTPEQKEKFTELKKKKNKNTDQSDDNKKKNKKKRKKK